ncbi:MFS transporter [Nonomuraea sp. B12E4]|uniref:MFS transporter n=1 Tax=Nonomuraea sp. B12E4 TaxID=3153564 RepID=UPI00325CD4ED
MGFRKPATFAVMCTGMFVVLLDVTIVNVALPSIGRGTGVTHVADLQWVIGAYQLTLAGLLLFGGALAERYGHRRILTTGFVIFGLASVACALAPGLWTLVAARAVQGTGAALLLPATLAVVIRLYTRREEHARAVCAWAVVTSLSLPAGPVLGGLLVELLGWPWIFWINVPVVVLVVAGTAYLVVESAPEPRPLDVTGAVLGTAALALVAFTVIETGRLGAWPPVFLLPAALALAAGIAFVLTERHRAHPVLPVSLLSRRPIAVSTIVAAGMNFGINGVIILFSIFLQVVGGHTPIESGLALLPLFVPLVLLPAHAARTAARRGPEPVMLAGLVLLVAGFAPLLALRADSGYGALVVGMTLIGAGAGLLTPAIVALAMTAAPPAGEGLTSALNTSARQAGGVLGVAALGAIAGDPARPAAFVSGVHDAAIVAGAVYLGAALLTLVTRSETAGPFTAPRLR